MDNSLEAPRGDGQHDEKKKGYQEIVLDRLGITKDFFVSHSGTMLDRLRAVSRALTGLGSEPSNRSPRRPSGPGNIHYHVQDIYDPDISHNLINICVHIASSVVLLESKATLLNTALVSVAEEFPNVDSSTVLTACTLYYIMHDSAEAAKTNGELETIHRHFDAMDWLIGQEAMRRLNIERLP
jgi:hypothetical protein